MGLVAPCSMTHWDALQGNASGSSMPAVTNRPIRMHGSAIRHPLRPWWRHGKTYYMYLKIPFRAALDTALDVALGHIEAHSVSNSDLLETSFALKVP